MLLRFILIGVAFVVIVFIFDYLMPKLRLKYKLHKQLKEKKKRQEAFREKMKKLEIQ